MALELVTPLPPGAPSHTRLARHGSRLVVLREIKDGTDCSYPPPSPRMVTLQEVGELQGKRHALFEWVPGVTLRDLIRSLDAVGNPIPLGLVARVVIDAARALGAVQPRRTHGGLQDAALQIGFDGAVSVLDFGAPRMTRFRPLGRVNFAADVFALGAITHACLTGFKGDYTTAAATVPPPSSSHSEATPALDDVVMRAISTQADSRQADPATFADELEVVVGESVFTTEQVANVVQALFRERIKLLQSLGGLVPSAESQPDLEAELPLPGVPLGTQPGIPMGTQPGIGGGPSTIRLDGEGPAEQQSEPTLPRVEAKELQPIPKPPKPVVPWDSNPEMPPLESADPTQPGRRALRDDERTNAISAAELAAAQDKKRAAIPPDTNPGVADEGTEPRGRPRAVSAVSTEDTAPRPRPSRPHPADTDETTGGTPTGPVPNAPPKPRFTTEAERLRAYGQERIRTPPTGTPALSDDDDMQLDRLDEPTNVKARPKPVRDPQQFAQTAQQLKPVEVEEEGEGEAEAPSGGSGLRWVLRIMAVLVAALMVGVIVKVKRMQEDEQAARDAELEQQLLAAEGGADAGEVDAAAPLAAIDAPDSGEDEEDLDDGGVEDDDDAGVVDVDAGVEAPDAGATKADAGAAVKKTPVKRPVKKKKRRR